MKRWLAVLLAVGLLLGVRVCSAAEDMEEGKLNVFGFGPIRSLNYIARYAEGGPVVLGVDGGWNPERSIAVQEPMRGFNMLYMQPSASNEAYAPKHLAAVSEMNVNNRKQFATQVARLLDKKFPTQVVVLYGFSRGGWYINELYSELKARGRKILFVWSCDGVPGDDKTIYGYPDVESDHVPIYIANSSTGAGKIVKRTGEYGQSGLPDVVFYKKYECKHDELAAAAADDLKATILSYLEKE